MNRARATGNASTVLDTWCDRGRGDHVAVECEDRSWTYARLLDEVCAVARGLLDLGLRRGDRVLLLLDDGPEFHAVFLGALRVGLVPVPGNPALGADDHRHLLVDSGAKVVVEPATYAALAVDQTYVDPVDVDGPGFLLYSSGSTGRPKGVVHRHRDLTSTAETFGAHVLEVNADDRMFCTSKMFHAYGLGNNLIFPLWFGGTAVILPGRRDLPGILDTIAARRPTLLASVPSVYRALLAVPGARDLSSVRRATSAGEALPPAVFADWAARGLELLDGIGSTELLATFCSNRPGQVRPGTSGVPVPGFQVRLVADGVEVEGAGAGVLQVAGDTAFTHYWNRPPRTESWVSTGDLYARDDDGYYTFQGRADDVFKISGQWVSPVDIEDVLAAHPGVRESAVVGVPDATGLTRVVAYVVPSASTDDLIAQLRDWVRPRLRHHQYPRTIEVVPDLPRTPTGKVQRFRLREQGRS
ncbi:AMP-binding protein [Actinokineospora inagensis]|uniref:AMP-binding protein n=1 Tax=Actinokineospora inagensis TaxID=103730 RepID=UPI0004000124|nr:AMP-binding protein [Actinokineospora inagensis]